LLYIVFIHIPNYIYMFGFTRYDLFKLECVVIVVCLSIRTTCSSYNPSTVTFIFIYGRRDIVLGRGDWERAPAVTARPKVIYIRTHTHTHTRTHTPSHTHTCTRMHAPARTHARTHARAHTHTHTLTHTHMYIYIMLAPLCLVHPSPLDLTFGTGASNSILFAAIDSGHLEGGQAVAFDVETGQVNKKKSSNDLDSPYG